MAAWIDGMSVDEATAFASAADLLAQARLPAIAGLVADVDAIRAGIRLAEAIGGMVDPLGAPELYAALGGLVSAGQMATTPTEAVCRADLVVAVGEAAARSPLLHRLAASSPVHGSTAGTAREIMVLGGSPPEAIAHKACPLHPAGLAASIALLRAVAAGRMAGISPELTALAGALRSARFGVVIYDPGELGELAAQALVELVQDVSETGRCFAIPLADAWQGQVVLQVSAWMSGLYPRQGYGRGIGEHDPWRFDLGRAAAAGEVDAMLWLAPLRAPAPRFGPALPTVALVGTPAGDEASIVLEVAVPGESCAGAVWDERRGAITHRGAAQPGASVTASAALERLGRQIASLRSGPC